MLTASITIIAMRANAAALTICSLTIRFACNHILFRRLLFSYSLDYFAGWCISIVCPPLFWFLCGGIGDIGDIDTQRIISRCPVDSSAIASPLNKNSGQNSFAKNATLPQSELSNSDHDNAAVSGAVILTSQQQTAENFNPLSAAVSSRVFQGQKYDKQVVKTSMLMSGKRKRVARLVDIADEYGTVYQVMKSNMFDSLTEERGIHDEKLKDFGRDMKRRIVQVAGRDYDNEDHCLVCWVGGDLLCCDGCPASYHYECLGLTPKTVTTKGVSNQWRCPLHTCKECEKQAAQVGGCLFRCSQCPNAFCDDHLPEDAVVFGRCERLEKCKKIFQVSVPYNLQRMLIRSADSCIALSIVALMELLVNGGSAICCCRISIFFIYYMSFPHSNYILGGYKLPDQACYIFCCEECAKHATTTANT
jgi:hypothetical protein